MVLLDNREVRHGWDALKQRVSGLMTKHGAEVISAKLWDERRLAYPIRRQQRGTYLLVYFDAPTGELTAINRELNMAEPVMRHLVTVCDALPEDVHAPEREFDAGAVSIEEVSVDVPEPSSPPAEEAKGDKDKGDKDKGEKEPKGEQESASANPTPSTEEKA